MCQELLSHVSRMDSLAKKAFWGKVLVRRRIFPQCPDSPAHVLATRLVSFLLGVAIVADIFGGDFIDYNRHGLIPSCGFKKAFVDSQLFIGFLQSTFEWPIRLKITRLPSANA